MSENKVLTMEEVCSKCSTGKFVEGKCTAYPPAGQARWYKLGWCQLGSTGLNPPADWKKVSNKVRVGQQKQKKQ